MHIIHRYSTARENFKKKQEKTPSTHHPVYLAESGLPRDHHALFVETHEAGPSTGHIYHVKGNIQEGMIFEHRVAAEPPEEMPGFCGKEMLG
ncbi:hypothetical protein BBP40_007700, partial [Aspergillus hancockii]